jgi:hypothetical protein
LPRLAQANFAMGTAKSNRDPKPDRPARACKFETRPGQIDPSDRGALYYAAAGWTIAWYLGKDIQAREVDDFFEPPGEAPAGENDPLWQQHVNRAVEVAEALFLLRSSASRRPPGGEFCSETDASGEQRHPSPGCPKARYRFFCTAHGRGDRRLGVAAKPALRNT